MSEATGGAEPGPALDPVEQAAVRKLMDVLDPEELSPNENMVDRAKRVGEEWQRMTEQMNTLSNQLIDLTEQVDELSAAVDNDSYESLTREQKRLRVKRLVQNIANENGGRGAVDYSDIRASFNNKIPAGSAHYLMEQIAEDEGYHLDKRDKANDALKVELSETENQFFSSE